MTATEKKKPEANMPKPKGFASSLCLDCKGTGHSIGSQLTPCADCGGHGRRVVLQ